MCVFVCVCARMPYHVCLNVFACARLHTTVANYLGSCCWGDELQFRCLSKASHYFRTPWYGCRPPTTLLACICHTLLQKCTCRFHDCRQCFRTVGDDSEEQSVRRVSMPLKLACRKGNQAFNVDPPNHFSFPL